MFEGVSVPKVLRGLSTKELLFEIENGRVTFDKTRGVLIPKIEGGADNPSYFIDQREPFIFADIPAVTLAATAKALYPSANFPVLGAKYFSRPGKKLRIRAFGKITTAATPGNGSFDVYWGTGGDANGVLLATSGTFALTLNKTDFSWDCDISVSCRSIGSTGTLFCDGKALFNNGVVANTLQPILIPASGAVVSGACDLTADLIVSLQFKRSGSTVETMAVQDLEVYAN